MDAEAHCTEPAVGREAARMKPSAFFDRVVNVAEELVYVRR
jgi:hypothetical protein